MRIRRIFANIPTLITPAAPCPFLEQGTAYTWVKFRRSLPSKLGQFETIVNTYTLSTLPNWRRPSLGCKKYCVV